MALIALAAPVSVFAHAGETHDDPGIAITSTEQIAKKITKPTGVTTTTSSLPERIANLGGPFSLVNHLGQSVTDQTYAGKHMLVFFGYGNCQIMCSISLKRIADAINLLQADSNATLTKFHALVVTVDPANDTPSRLRETLATYHPALIGLTGTLEQLKPVYKAYGLKPSILETELNDNPIVSHTSYFYLMGPDGKLQTFFPPVLSAKSMADVIKKYLPI